MPKNRMPDYVRNVLQSRFPKTRYDSDKAEYTPTEYAGFYTMNEPWGDDLHNKVPDYGWDVLPKGNWERTKEANWDRALNWAQDLSDKARSNATDLLPNRAAQFLSVFPNTPYVGLTVRESPTKRTRGKTDIYEVRANRMNMPITGGIANSSMTKGKTMKRFSMHKKDSVLTPPSFSIDPLDPKNDAAYYDYLDALDWEKADMESNRGRIYEQKAGRGPRRDITSRNAPGYHDFDGKEYMHVPKRLNSGRNFWGFTGSRAGLSPMTKRMIKNDKSKHKESKWEKDVARLAQIFDPRAFMNRDRLGVVEETNIFGIPYTGARTAGSTKSMLLPFNTAPFTQFGNKNYIGSGPTRGSSAMKSMHKSISSMNQGGVKHVVGGYRGGKMSKAMDMKTHAPKMPSTKRDIRNTDKYFN